MKWYWWLITLSGLGGIGYTIAKGDTMKYQADKPGYATEHFSWDELLSPGNRKACKDLMPWAKEQWDTPGKNYRDNMKKLLTEIVEPMREHVGQPFIVTSGFRPSKLNSCRGGDSDSQHLSASAVDLHPQNDRTEGFKRAFEWVTANRDIVGECIFYGGNPAKGDYSSIHRMHISIPGRRKVWRHGHVRYHFDMLRHGVAGPGFYG